MPPCPNETPGLTEVVQGVRRSSLEEAVHPPTLQESSGGRGKQLPAHNEKTGVSTMRRASAWTPRPAHTAIDFSYKKQRFS